MNLIEAMKTGKKFRRPHWSAECWLTPMSDVVFSFSISDVLADDWEVKPEPREFKLFFWSNGVITRDNDPVGYVGRTPPTPVDVIKVREVLE